jgi:tRNA dimethylallyltransferase
MFRQGFIAEVQRLLAEGYECGLPAMSGIGYRQVCQHLGGSLDLPTAVERTKTETHRLARAQAAWFPPDDQRITWIAGNSSDIREGALRVVRSELFHGE